MYCAIIGREISLAYAELESTIGTFEKINSESVIFDYNKPKEININNFGTLIKLGSTNSKVKNIADLYLEIPEIILQYVQSKDTTSINFGISIYGKKVPYKIYKKLLINAKKSLAKNRIKARFVESSTNVLNAAQIKHNNLTSTGLEILLLFSKNDIIIATTNSVQDIDSYSKRDYGRPCRDMKVGMFPPKLAQGMISMANIEQDSIVYDPFCGSGIVLQEALLQDYESWGSDISDNMVKCSTANLEWLKNNYSINKSFNLFSADATRLKDLPSNKYHIVTEGYLGNPFSQIPSREVIDKVKNELSSVYLGFLKTIMSASNLPQNIVLALPCWKQNSNLEYLNIIDQILKLGYTIKQFQSVQFDEIIYKRPNQIVGRQVLVLIPKI